MATTGYTKNFVVKNGITTGSITLDANSGNITGTNLSVTGLSNLGNIGNVKITGGNSGQAIVTDGAGNLSFANASATSSPAPMPTYVALGDDVVISANYQGLFGYPITIDGTLTVDGVLIDVNDNRGSDGLPGGLDTQVQYNDDGAFGGNAGFTFNKTTGVFSAPSIVVSGNITPSANVTYSLGNNTNRFNNLYLAGNTIDLGGAIISANATAITFTNPAGGAFVVAGSTTDANMGNVATANYFVGSGNGLSNIQGANVSGAVNLATYATTANAVAGANVSGAVSFATTANSVAGANVSGAVAYATTANSVAGANVSGAVALANYASIANSVAGANVSGEVSYASVANSVSAANVSGAVALANYASIANSVAGANVSGAVALANYASIANSVAGANVSGAVPYASVANSIAGANISGQVSNAAIAGTVYTNAQPNITSVGTLTSLTVNGNISANNANITGNIIPTSNNTYSLGSASSYWKDAYIGPGSLYINGVKVLEESSNAIVISADLNQTVKVTSSGSGDVQLQTTGTGVIAVKGPLQIQAANYITSSNGGPIGFSNPINVDTISSLSANTNLTISANGTGNIQINDDVTITGNLTINGGGGNLSVSSLTVEDNIIDISAETTGVPVNNAGIRVIRGDEPSVQNRWNETTETWQITNDGSTYLNVVGSNTSTGNANVGNIGASSGVFTTVVGSLTTNAQPNITSTGILSSLSVSGNANTGNIGTNNLVASGTGSFGANVNMNSHWINNVGYPTANTDAASKQYVDTMVSTGISYHQPVNVATTTTLATATGGTTSYNSPNGAANGIGAYISTTGTFLNVDGANVQTVGTRILVKNEANAAWNGVYTYANTTAIVRSSDTDTYGVDLNGTEHLGINDYFLTLGGVVNKGTSFIVSAPTGTITFGTSNIEFSTFSTSQVYDAGTGLTLTGTTFSVNASQTQVTEVGTLSSLSVSGNANVGNIGATNGVFTNVSGNGSALTSIAGANVTGAVAYASTANAVAGGNVSGQVSYAATANSVAGANVSGEVSYAATANSVAGANVSGAVSFATTANAVAGANVSGAVNLASYATTANSVALANVSGAGNIASLNINGNASTVLYGNGVFASLPPTYGNSNVATLLASFGSNAITTTGNVSVGNIIGNGQALTSITGANVSGAVAFATTANSVAGANVSGVVSSATIAGTVTTAAQPNITSVGTLSSVAITGNATAGNVYANTGTIGASLLTGTLTTASQSNITSVGTLSSLAVTGNTTAGNVNVTGQLISTVSTGTSPLIVSSTTKVANLNADLLDGYDSASAATASTIVLRSADGSIFANIYYGAGNNLSNIQGANVTGTVSSSTTAGTVTTAAQPNITSVGTLTSANISGILTVRTANANAGGFAPTIAAKSTGDGIGSGIMVEGNAADATMNMGYDGTSMFLSSSYRTSAGYKPMAFYTSGTQRVTIATGGAVGFGTNSPSYPLHINQEGGLSSIGLTGTAANATNFRLMQGVTGVTNSGFSIYDLTNSAIRFVVDSSGRVLVGYSSSVGSYALQVSGNIYLSGTLTEASSIKIKENVKPITNALDIVCKLEGVTYDKKDGSSYNEPGFIAEKVAEVIETLVDRDKDGNPMGVKYNKTIAYLVEAIKELKAEIDLLKGAK